MQHNKKMNAGLIFNILSNKLLEMSFTKQDEIKNKLMIEKTEAIINKYFTSESLLYQESKVFKDLMGTNVKDKLTALRIIGALLETIQNTDIKSNIEVKNELLKECCDLYGKEFLKTKIGDYKIYGAIGTLIEATMNHKKIDPTENILLEDSIAEYMTRPESEIHIPEGEEVDDLTYYYMYETFQNEHLSNMNEEQQDAIRYYMHDAQCDLTNMKSYLIKGIRGVQNFLKEQELNDDIVNERHLAIIESSFGAIKEDADNLKRLIESSRQVEQEMFDSYMDILEVIGNFKAYTEDLNIFDKAGE
jgi:hypothetical protein